MLGFEAARFLPSGTMAQQIAMRVWCERAGVRHFGMHPTSHLELHEERGYAHLHGLHAHAGGPAVLAAARRAPGCRCAGRWGRCWSSCPSARPEASSRAGRSWRRSRRPPPRAIAAAPRRSAPVGVRSRLWTAAARESPLASAPATSPSTRGSAPCRAACCSDEGLPRRGHRLAAPARGQPLLPAPQRGHRRHAARRAPGPDAALPRPGPRAGRGAAPPARAADRADHRTSTSSTWSSISRQRMRWLPGSGWRRSTGSGCSGGVRESLVPGTSRFELYVGDSALTLAPERVRDAWRRCWRGRTPKG